MSPKVVFVSMVEDVNDSRITRIRESVGDFGYEIVTVMTGVSGAGSARHVELERPERLFLPNGGGLNAILALAGRLPRFFQGLRAVWRERPDICHCHEPDSWLIGVIMKAAVGSRVVVDLHEIYEARAATFPSFLQGVMHWLIRSSMRGLSRYTDVVLHVSPFRMRHYAYLRCDARVIGNYPVVPAIGMSRVAIERTDGRFILVHAGTLRLWYAAGELLEAVDQAAEVVQGLELHVIGGVWGSLGAHEDRRKDLERRGLLRIMPRIPHSEVFIHLRQADVGITLVLPVDANHRLAVPRKMYEYFAAGLPVIGPSVPDVVETIRKWDCGIYVDATDPADIAGAIVQLASNNEEARRLGRNSRQAAEEQLNWDSQRRKLNEVYPTCPPAPPPSPFR